MTHRWILSIVILCCSSLILGDIALAAKSEGRRGRSRFRRNLENTKNATAVKTVVRSATADAATATVRVLAEGKPAAMGTIISADGRIITKASLLPAGAIACRLADGRVLDATVIGRDEAYDLALLRVEAKDLQAIEWREGIAPAAGTIVSAPTPNDGPLGIGVISDRAQEIPGPSRRGSRQGWLGVTLELADGAVEVQSVAPESAAARAGIQAGDRIKRLNGDEIKSVEQAISTIGRLPPGRTVKLLVQRGEAEVELSATLERLDPTRMPGAKLSQDMWGGGPFSEKRWGFPMVVPHDIVIAPADCGGPLVDTDGKAVGINIARALRVATYAVPAKEVREVAEALGKRAEEK